MTCVRQYTCTLYWHQRAPHFPARNAACRHTFLLLPRGGMSCMPGAAHTHNHTHSHSSSMPCLHQPPLPPSHPLPSPAARTPGHIC
eukprot:362948-Chlamydomonas_euryale.AAC.11